MSALLGGRYKLGEMIGTGGMADVYIAKDERLSRKVAIKVLRSDLARDPSFVARFRKEALAAAGLNHPGIVAVYDSGEKPAPYIVMELISGHTLRELMHRDDPLPIDRALEIGEGILAALEYSHERGIVHRDVKPANVMITDEGVVKVMDFGIARALDDFGATLTSTWNVIGTAQYLSPEQAMGEIADHRSDIYSTGCLLYEVFTGRPPFIGDTPVSIAFQQVSADLIKPSSLNAELPQGVDILLGVALAKKPVDRYQSAAAMLADIQKLRAGQSVTAKIARKGISRRQFIIGAISTLVIGGILALGTYAVGGLIRTTNQSNSLIVVPNVVGLTQPEAQSLLGDFVVTIQRAHDPLIPKDRVASQIPLATSKAKKGTGVVLTLSDGVGDSTVPSDLVGKLLVDARASLAAAGLVIAQTQAVSSTRPQGTVLSVSPPGGSTITAGSGVILKIASGNIQVPALTGVTAIKARTVLAQAGFLVNQIAGYDPTQSLGIVLAQAPDAGTTQTIGSTVTITVNQTPPVTPTPIDTPIPIDTSLPIITPLP